MLQQLSTMLDAKDADADAIYPPASTELRLYAGLLAAYRDDQAGVAKALRETKSGDVVSSYPTLTQLQQVVQAEYQRLQGHPEAAMRQLAPLAAKDTALVAVHWALMRSARASGNEAVAHTQEKWMLQHRGRVFAEATTVEVLRFFNVSVAAAALKKQKADS